MEIIERKIFVRELIVFEKEELNKKKRNMGDVSMFGFFFV